MQKRELVNLVVAETGLTVPDVLPILEATFKAIKDQMTKGEELHVRGFGSFKLKVRAHKVARNIKTGAPVEVPAHVIPYFKPAKEFLNDVKKNNSVQEEGSEA